MAVWYLDQGYHLDAQDGKQISAEVELAVEETYHHRPLFEHEIVAEADMGVDVVHSVPLDLLSLVPEKFRSSEILQEYLRTAGIQFSQFLAAIQDITKLLNPNTVSSTRFLRELGALVGVKFPPEDTSTAAELRKTLADAVDWYKVKGTYGSIDIIALIQTFAVNLYDMYTNDYDTFVLTDWFVGNENENPPGLDSSYYKSPHFGAEVVLNQAAVPSGSSTKYLWQAGTMDNFAAKVEETRPVHTVPHFLLLLNPITDEFGHVIQTLGSEIKTRVTSGWQYGAKYFDMSESGSTWSFDDGSMTFDTSAEGFLKSVTKWVLGVGNYPCQLGNSSFDIQVPVLTGTISPGDITIHDDYFQFEFIVPKTEVQNGLSELGLYIPGTPDTLVLASCFPKIDKDATVELRVVVQVHKSDLSV